MKIAITSSGDHLNATIDSRFGRCSYFAIHDTNNQETIFLANPNKESAEGAGPASAQFVVNQEISRVASGEFGGKVKSIFKELEIDMVSIENHEMTISEIINLLQSNN